MALLPVMQQDIDAAMAGISILVTLSVHRLRDILKYYFLPPTPNASKMKKDALLREAHEFIENYKRLREEEVREECITMVEA